MKEAFRSVSPALTPDVAYVLVARKPAVTATLARIVDELLRLTAQYRS
jgi:RNase P protein component